MSILPIAIISSCGFDRSIVGDVAVGEYDCAAIKVENRKSTAILVEVVEPVKACVADCSLTVLDVETLSGGIAECAVHNVSLVISGLIGTVKIQDGILCIAATCLQA